MKPISRNKSIVRFSRDHHHGLLLIWKIREGLRRNVEPVRISDYAVRFFENEIVPHFQDEELNLFCRLPVENELRLRAEDDHRKIYDLINLIRDKRSDQVHLVSFADLLERHIRFEERELFNFIQDTLNETELAEIETAGVPAKCITDEEWQDKFWN